ncbi:acetyltransferase [Luteipulveratus mongoliensis]|uniref:Lysine N-acyltransferase MbtK n=2 Tax=Luteipulveratus mongoliensis TaxID=571913 RepID=A0A0K1JQF1_9MICO|nr:acetyltransferase [Luteipulveratus mongoliensis]
MTSSITLAPFDGDRDSEVLHQWVTHPRSVYWGMQHSSVSDVETAYRGLALDPYHHAFVGFVDAQAQFLMEVYDPRHRELADVPEIEHGDVGMHLLVAPAEQPVHGFTRSVMRAVLQYCFQPEEVRRVVVEPDVRNTKIAALNAAAGFRVVREVPLHDKVAALSFCTRAQFEASELGGDLA